MAKNKNSLSDEKVKGAAGGRYELGDDGYLHVYDDNTNKLIYKTQNRDYAMVAESLYRDGYEDGNRHLSQSVDFAYKKGLADGINKAIDQMRKEDNIIL